MVDRSSKTVVMFSRIYDKVHHQLCREEARNGSSPEFLKTNEDEEKLEKLAPDSDSFAPPPRCSSCTASSNSIAIADCGEQREKQHVVVVVGVCRLFPVGAWMVCAKV